MRLSAASQAVRLSAAQLSTETRLSAAQLSIETRLPAAQPDTLSQLK